MFKLEREKNWPWKFVVTHNGVEILTAYPVAFHLNELTVDENELRPEVATQRRVLETLVTGANNFTARDNPFFEEYHR